MCGCLSCAPTTDLACNPGMCPDWESNWWPLGSQAGAQSTEPHQPGWIVWVLYILNPCLRYLIELFLERGKREREREKHLCERETSISRLSYSPRHPDQGPNPQPNHVPWLGIKLVTFWFEAWCPTHWATMVRKNFSNLDVNSKPTNPRSSMKLKHNEIWRKLH